MKALGFSTSAVFLAVTTTAVTRLAASWGGGGGERGGQGYLNIVKLLLVYF